MAGEFESLGVDKINVGGRYRKDYAVRLCNIFGDEVTGLLLNIGWLITNGDLTKCQMQMCTNEVKRNPPLSDLANRPELD